MQLRLEKRDSAAPGHPEKQLPYIAVLPTPVVDPIQVLLTTGPASGARDNSRTFYHECRQAVHNLLRVDVCVHADCATVRHVTPRGLRRTLDKFVQLPVGGNVRVEIPAAELQQRFELPELPGLPSLWPGLQIKPIWGLGDYRLRRGGTT